MSGQTEKPEAYVLLKKNLLEYLDGLKGDDRLNTILDFQHRLEFERRLMTLTPEERTHMDAGPVSSEAQRALDAETTESGREARIEMYARSHYFRKCAWEDYLNGVTNEKPFDSAKKAPRKVA